MHSVVIVVTDRLVCYYIDAWYILPLRELFKGVGTGVAAQPWLHQYFNKKWVCVLFFNSLPDFVVVV